MVIELLFVGVFIGGVAGFFGIGGGIILIPILLLLGYDTKDAIGISIIQMVFSSLYGSYLNFKKGSLIINDGISIGLGGFLGGFIGGYTTSFIPDIFLKFLFIGLLIFAIFRLFFTKLTENEDDIVDINKWILFLIGFLIGIFSISLGIGGAIILTPLLVGFLHYPIKKAVSAGLFFIAFSSVSGLISRFLTSTIDLRDGLIVAFSSLLGVFIGIYLKEKISSQNHKVSLLLLYSFALIILIKKIFF